MEQKIITSERNYQGLDQWLDQNALTKVLLVCGKSIRYQKGFSAKLEEIKEAGKIDIIRFSDFQPNPLYESVLNGIKAFHTNGCQGIIAAGGGSAMDVAKCIKLYSNMEGNGDNGSYLKQEIVPNDIPFLAMPTTAGTGSEATRYAVIYYKGVKQSVTSESSIPGTVLIDPDCLRTLPVYQKKATMMDAFCHAIESFWSVNSTPESREFSREAISSVMKYMDGYLANTDQGNAGMLRAAFTAGRAINITQTTAGHAMCYKITSLFGLAHGHAAILCDRVLFPWMLKNTDKCIDSRGETFLKDVFCDIGHAMGCDTPEQAAEKINRIFDNLEFEIPSATPEQYDELRNSVNPVRLKNHPIALNMETIDSLYHEILR